MLATRPAPQILLLHPKLPQTDTLEKARAENAGNVKSVLSLQREHRLRTWMDPGGLPGAPSVGHLGYTGSAMF